ncbi:hypothetical protein BQ8482_20052 [Mesorhizobium delmotii]|uniref:Uncharacterized protein n=1 Tax=Mesorhizobium delmotii TaxID=1631247 RepID=A0A2P9AK21_9HYPH|nr:hypothetical protein BQ8482_20052 [Mesorhizobium delmotii]
MTSSIVTRDVRFRAEAKVASMVEMRRIAARQPRAESGLAASGIKKRWQTFNQVGLKSLTDPSADVPAIKPERLEGLGS